jgi:hypothetical protein
VPGQRQDGAYGGVMAWLILVVSGVLEAVWATALSKSEGFTRLVPSVIFGVALLQSMARTGHRDAGPATRYQLRGMGRHRGGAHRGVRDDDRRGERVIDQGVADAGRCRLVIGLKVVSH